MSDYCKSLWYTQIWCKSQ